MRTLFQLNWLLLATVLLFGGCNLTKPPHHGEDSPLVGKTAPDIEGKMLDDSDFSLKKEYGNKIVLLDFWATWCGPCVEELPILLNIAEDYKDKGVVLYTVNQGDDPAAIKAFMANQGRPMNVVLDPDGRHASAYQVSGIPQLVIINQGGVIQELHVGYSEDLEQELRALLHWMTK